MHNVQLLKIIQHNLTCCGTFEICDISHSIWVSGRTNWRQHPFNSGLQEDKMTYENKLTTIDIQFRSPGEQIDSNIHSIWVSRSTQWHMRINWRQQTFNLGLQDNKLTATYIQFGSPGDNAMRGKIVFIKKSWMCIWGNCHSGWLW